MNPSPGIDENGTFTTAFKAGKVREVPNGGMQMDVDADGADMVAAINHMEELPGDQPRRLRATIARYLLRVANDLVSAEPQLHVVVDEYPLLPHQPPIAIVKVTRLLYASGHPANEDATDPGLFSL